MEHERYKKLLSEMPAISKAINAFASEAVQQEAFRALVDALGIEVTAPEHEAAVDRNQQEGNRKKVAARRRAPAKTPDSKSPGPAAAGFDAQAVVNALKERPDFGKIEERILHPRSLGSKVRLILLTVNGDVTSGDITRVLQGLDLKVGLPRVSEKLKTMSGSLIGSTKRGQGVPTRYKLTAPARSEFEGWLNETLK